ncbi:hypothetical protein [Vibrio parahaemolyticus]|uniref:hypothetical protein n=1 Tax=Vibrio parahaemolyticus TaxID=670 RepID=UPI00235FA02D|nr:hypothetical protein [Vibrio parahaemolyticus]
MIDIKELGFIVNRIKLFYKPIIIVSVISGAIYLNGFLSEFGIPFPVDIGVLTSALLTIGAVSLLIVTILLIYVFLVCVVHYDLLKIGFHLVINTSRQGVYSYKKRNYFTFYLLTYFIPILLIMSGWYLYHEDVIGLKDVLVSIFSYSVFFVTYGYFSCVGSYVILKQRINFSLKLYLHMLISQLATIMSLFIFVSLLVRRVGNMSDLEFLGVVIVYLMVNFLCLVPIFSKKFMGKIKEGRDVNLTPDDIVKRIYITPIWSAIALMLVFSYLPMFSHYVGELPLRLLNLGGGIEFVAIGGRRQCDSWPEFVVNEKISNSCTTFKGKLLIQLGDRAYAIFNDNHRDVVVSLNMSKSSIVTDIPKNSFYWNHKD